MLKRGLPFLFLLFLIVNCTQFMEDDDAGKDTYTGNDGCVYCHTNSERLKALAPAEGGGEGAGGG